MHMFMPGHTIKAVIKQYNGLDISEYDYKILITEFNKVNQNNVPRPGEKFKIPITKRSDTNHK